MKPRTRPSDVLLDLMRGRSAKGRSAAYLVEACGLFGFTENTVRVNLSRLQARGLIESPRRGVYRLAATADPVNDFVERWRLGEQRVRPWRDGAWIFVHLSEVDDHGFWALDALGFREVRAALFARPDNLTLSAGELERLALGIGVSSGALFVYGSASEAASTWSQRWDCASYEVAYLEMRQRLLASAARVAGMPRDEARLETFRLGGEAINLLAKDPLLPEQWVDPALRAELWQATIDYDRQGKQIWAHNTSVAGVFPVARAAQASLNSHPGGAH